MAKSEANKELEILQGDGWELDEISVQCATNGYTVRVSYDKADPDEDDSYESRHKSQEHVFTERAAVGAFVEECLKQDEEGDDD